MALTLSLLLAREHSLAQTSPAFEGTLAKIRRVLPPSTRERLQAVRQTVLFQRSTAHAAPSLVAVMLLSSAVQNGQCVRLRYHSAHAEVTERTFNPYGVIAHEGFWYTIGYCHLRQGQRLLRLDRIMQIEVTSEMFLRPASFDTLTSVQRALASVPRVWQVEVWLETTVAEAQRKSQLSKGHFTKANEGVLLRCAVDDLPWMACLIAGLDMPFIIHHPPELRTVLRQHALTLMRNSERTANKENEEKGIAG